MTPEARRFSEAVSFHQAGDLESAERGYRKVLASKISPVLAADAANNLGVLCRSTGRLDEAERFLRMAVRNRPDWSEPHYNLGNLYYYTQRLDEAKGAFERTLQLRPDHPHATFNLALTLLGLGEWSRGWDLYAVRKDRLSTPLRQVNFPEWRGEDLTGKSVLVWREQGFGDELMMARFIPQLKARGATRVTVAPPIALLRLFKSLAGVDEVVELIGTVTIPSHDYWVLPCSLPGLMQLTPPSFPTPPYLAPPPEARARWAGFAPAGRFNIGFVWQGNPAQANDTNRSLPSAAPLLALEDLGVNLIDLQTPRGDFADTAAIVEQMDLIITVDTAMSHVAGALDVPCWVMLAYLGTDWRYPLPGGTQSEWYPKTTVFRQERPGDWDGVMARIRSRLADMNLARST